MRHDPGLAASPPVRYILKMAGSGVSLLFAFTASQQFPLSGFLLIRGQPGTGLGSGRGARVNRLGGGLGPVEQRLAAQLGGDRASLADGGLRGAGLTIAEQAPRVIQQSVGEVVGAAMYAYIGHRGGKDLVGGGVAVGSCEPRAGQIALRSQPRGDVPRRMPIDVGEQLADSSGVTKFVRDADGERPGPADVPESNAKRTGVGNRRAGVPQCVLGLSQGDRGEGVYQADKHLVL